MKYKKFPKNKFKNKKGEEVDTQDKFSPSLSLASMASHYMLEDGIEKDLNQAVDVLHKYFRKHQLGNIIMYKKLETIMSKLGYIEKFSVDTVADRMIENYGYVVLDPSAVVWPSTRSNRLVMVPSANTSLHEEEKWMQKAAKTMKKGALRKSLGKKKDEKISKTELEKLKKSKNPLTRKRATMALNFRGGK